MLQKILGSSRYLIIIAVLGSYMTAVIIIIYSAFLPIHVLIELLLHPDLSVVAARRLAVECIELIDAFLLGTAFYIVALGLYELFINRLASTPDWLRVQNLNDLKARLLAVIILVLSVYFLEQLINWDGKSDILALGIAEALIIGVIALAIKLQEHVTIGPASTLPEPGLHQASDMADEGQGSRETDDPGNQRGGNL